MDELLPKLLAFPPHPPPPTPLSDSQYDAGIKSHIAALERISEKSLVQSTPSGATALDVSIAKQRWDG